MPDAYRLEPISRSDEVATGLAAQVHDPLWLLARQWQLGEFQAQDAGSPVDVHVTGTSTVVDAWSVDGRTWEPYDPRTVPLEAICEAEPIPSTDLSTLAAGGMHFLMLLAEHGLTDLTPALREAHGFAEVRPGGAGASLSVTEVLMSRAPDPRKLAALIDAGRSPLPAAAGAAGAAVSAAWRAWWAERSEPRSASDSFDLHRLEHTIFLATGGGKGTVLAAREYEADGVDWHRFDLEPESDDPPPREQVVPLDVHTLPATVRYSGIPADRFWEMEDAQVDFASADVSRLDTGRMLLIAFATVYGNDWFTVPLPVPAGSLTRIDQVMVTDTFGQRHLLKRAGSQNPGWNLYALGQAADSESPHPMAEALFVPPAAVRTDTGPPDEEVAFARDEMANLAWAIECRVRDAGGESVDRRERWLTRRAAAPPGRESGLPAYGVQTVVPDFWLPLVPEATGLGSVRLLLVPLQQVGDGQGNDPDLIAESRPAGRLLAGSPPVWLHEEEVPRPGVMVRRIPVLTRGHDGRYHSWIRRAKTVGTGEASSGLSFDSVRPSQPWPDPV